jgi:hypothetical protein
MGNLTLSSGRTPCNKVPTDDNATSNTCAKNHPEHYTGTYAGTVDGLGQSKAVCIIFELNWTPQPLRKIVDHRLAALCQIPRSGVPAESEYPDREVTHNSGRTMAETAPNSRLPSQAVGGEPLVPADASYPQSSSSCSSSTSRHSPMHKR